MMVVSPSEIVTFPHLIILSAKDELFSPGTIEDVKITEGFPSESIQPSMTAFSPSYFRSVIQEARQKARNMIDNNERCFIFKIQVYNLEREGNDIKKKPF